MSTFNEKVLQELKMRGVSLDSFGVPSEKILNSPINEVLGRKIFNMYGSLIKLDIPLLNGDSVELLGIQESGRMNSFVSTMLEVVSMVDEDLDYTLEKYSLRHSDSGFETSIAKNVRVNHLSDLILFVPKDQPYVVQALEHMINTYSDAEVYYLDKSEKEEKGLLGYEFEAKGDQTIEEVYEPLKNLLNETK